MRDKSILPEKWLSYSDIGERVAGTPFVAFKVPLDEKFNSSIREADRFTPAHLMHARPDLGLVIDLTNTLRYYSPEVIETCGAQHRKVACPGQVVPTANLVKRFCAIVDDFLRAGVPGRPLIGVHCTHGVNRTGYMICSYMIRHLGIPAAEAVLAFERARGYHIERAEYVEALLEQSKKETPDAGADLSQLLRHPKSFQLGVLAETPTPPDSRAGPSSKTWTLSSSSSDAAPTAAGAVPSATVPTTTASAACPLSTNPALPDLPLASTDAEKLVLVHAHAPPKKKKDRVVTASAKGKAKVKVKVKKRKMKEAAAPTTNSVKSLKNEGKNAQGRSQHTALATDAKEPPPGAAVTVASAVLASVRPPPLPAPLLQPVDATVSASTSPAEQVSTTKRGRGRRGRGCDRGRSRGRATNARGRTESNGSSRARADARGGVGDAAPRPLSRFSHHTHSGSVIGNESRNERTRPAVGTGRRHCGRGGGRTGTATRLQSAAAGARVGKGKTLPATAGISMPCSASSDLSASSTTGRGGRSKGRGRGGKFLGRGRGMTKGKQASLSSAHSAALSHATPFSPFSHCFTNVPRASAATGSTPADPTTAGATPAGAIPCASAVEPAPPTTSPTAGGSSARH